MSVYSDNDDRYDPDAGAEAPWPPPAGTRRPYRPPIGIPDATPESPWRSAVASVAFHALILFLLLVPIFASDTVQEAIAKGAGGPGPAGGGGGGRGGTGGERVQERLRYLQIAPAPPPTPAPVAPPVVPPVTPPVTPPPKPEPKPETPPVAPKIEIETDVPAAIDLSLTSGTGGGSGNDGTEGNGPGSGGGVGSGMGTGRGSGTGPGTGGGEGAIYPPTPTQVFIPPVPAPEKIKPYSIVAVFDVDERGNVRAFTFNKSKDGGYNRRLEQMLREVRFRPAVRAADGTPVPAKAVINYEVF